MPLFHTGKSPPPVPNPTTTDPAQRSLNININLSHDTMNTIAKNPEASSQQKLTMIIYGLYAASLLTGVSAIVLNHLKRSDMVGTVYESHFRWQMRTFWFGVLWLLIGVMVPGSLVLFGFSMFPLVAAAPLLIVGNAVWCIYRIVKGFLRLNDGKAMYAQ